MTALILDDEPLTREVIAEHLPWRALGVSRVLQAENGADALELLAHDSADLVISDVRMPEMDGLDFVAAVRRFNLRCQVIFISGYCEKDALKSALRLGAVDFLEKPLKLDELEASVRSAIGRLKQEAQREAALDFQTALRGQEEESKRFCAWLTQHSAAPPSWLSGGVPLQLFAVRLAPIKPPFELLLELKHALAACQVEVQCGAHLRSDIFLLVFKSSSDIPEALETSAAAYLMCGGYTDVPLQSENFARAVQSAIDAMECCYFYLAPHICRFIQKKPAALAREERQALLDTIENLQVQDLKQRLEALFDCLKDPAVSPAAVKQLLYALAGEMQQTARRVLNDPASVLFSSEELLSLQNSATLARAQHCFSVCGGRFEQYLRKSPYSPGIVEALRYLHKNYTDPSISISKIACAAYLSPAYLCSAFKKELHVTVNHYVQQLRMQAAAAQLSNPSLTLMQIADALGYGNANYFSKIFKRYMGITPSEYRAKACRSGIPSAILQ